MLATTIIGTIAVLLAYLARYRNFRYGLEIAFGILTVFLAIRYNWGNDYAGYFNGYTNIGEDTTGFFDFNNLGDRQELGWVILNKLCQPIGFFGMIALITIFEQFILYRFIKKNVLTQWHWLAVFVLIFNPTFMLTGTSMMRQFLAMCIFILAIEYINKRAIVPFILLILLASSFHSSAVILLPTYFIGYIRVHTSAQSLWWVVPAYALWFFFAPKLLDDRLLFLLQMDEFKNYSLYLDEAHDKFTIGIGVLFFSFVFFMFISHLKYTDRYQQLLMILCVLSFLITPFVSIAPMISRIGLYFGILLVATYPILVNKLSSRLLRVSFIATLSVITIYLYVGFFYSDVWHDYFFIYQTIFSS